MSGTFFTILIALYTVFGLFFYELRWFVEIDEILSFAIAGYACAQIWFKKIPNNKPLMIWLCIDLFYLAYSILIHLNLSVAVFSDFVMQSKPYMTFFGLMCLKPKMEHIHFNILQLFCLLCVPIMGVIYYFYPHVKEGTFPGELLTGAAFSSVAILISALYYMSCSRDSVLTRITTIGIMLLGFFDPTSKFLGTFISTLAIIFLIKKPIKFNLRYALTAVALITVVMFVVWDEVVFYFLTNSDLNARPVLYMNMPKVLNDYIPFGSGFATYANAASATWYSPLYSEYNMDTIWGLVEGDAQFVSDTYYPTLAQFGYVGVALFISLFVYIFRLMDQTYNELHDLKRYKVSLIIIAYWLIEATSSSFINERCILAMIILVLSLYKYQPAYKEETDMFGLKFIGKDKEPASTQTISSHENTDS